MSDTNPTTTPAGDDYSEALAALDRIDAELGTAGVLSLGKDDLCRQYRRIRGFLQTALRLIEAIPVWGGKIGTAVRFLMTIADQVCGTEG